MDPVDIGDCHDDDVDDWVSTSDNCPAVFNPDQADEDFDGRGDVCDGCEDLDGDGFGAHGDPACAGGPWEDCDDTVSVVFPGAPEICDGLDNDCDGGQDNASCDAFEATGDDTVDGLELAWMGRAFGDCSDAPLSVWWSGLDLNRDGCIDGDDLAILGPAFGCQGTEPVCD
jgi:hypothetical protein